MNNYHVLNLSSYTTPIVEETNRENWVDFLTENEELTNQIEDGLFEDSLSADDDSIEYQDPTNNFGGHL